LADERLQSSEDGRSGPRRDLLADDRSRQRSEIVERRPSAPARQVDRLQAVD